MSPNPVVTLDLVVPQPNLACKRYHDFLTNYLSKTYQIYLVALVRTHNYRAPLQCQGLRLHLRTVKRDPTINVEFADDDVQHCCSCSRSETNVNAKLNMTSPDLRIRIQSQSVTQHDLPHPCTKRSLFYNQSDKAPTFFCNVIEIGKS